MSRERARRAQALMNSVRAERAALGASHAEVKALVAEVAGELGDKEDMARDLLALLALAAYSGTANAEDVYINLESALMPYLSPTIAAADAFVAERLTELRKG